MSTCRQASPISDLDLYLDLTEDSADRDGLLSSTSPTHRILTRISTTSRFSAHESPMPLTEGERDGFEERLRQRTNTNSSHPLDTVPTDPGLRPRGKIPNTPLAASTLSFLLGIVFALGFGTFIYGGFNRFWWTTYQLGFYLAAWAAFHWGEFAVTAGWNKDKCSINCAYAVSQLTFVGTEPIYTAFLLENGAQYHIAHSFAIAEYLLTLYFKPSFKSHPYVSQVGKQRESHPFSRLTRCCRNCPDSGGPSTQVVCHDPRSPKLLACYCNAQGRHAYTRH